MKLDFSYINKNEKKFAVPPAFNNYVYTKCGGEQRYNDKIGAMYINHFVAQHSDVINQKILEDAKCSRLEVV